MAQAVEDTGAAIVFVVCTVAVFSMSWKTARTLFPRDSTRLCAVHCIVLSWSYIAVASFLASLAKSLGATTLYTLAVALSFIGFAWSQRYTGRRVLEQLPKIRWLLVVWPGCSSQETGRAKPKNRAADLIDGPRRKSSGVPATGSLARATIVWMWVLIATGMAVHVTVNGVFSFPTDYDTLMYHRPLVDQWIRAASLYAPNDGVWYNPSSNELLALWLAAPFSGDFWLGLSNIPSWVLLALAVFELTRLMGTHRIVGHLVTLSVVCSPVAIQQIECGKNDIAGCALFVAGLLYTLKFTQEGRSADLVYAGFAAGLVAGVKYYALGYAIVLCGFAMLSAFTSSGLRRGIRLAAFVPLLALTTGGYWYLRNLVVAGSPLHPLGSRPDTPTDVRIVRSVWDSSIIGSGQLSVLQDYAIAVLQEGGVFLMAAVIVCPAVVLWLVITGATKNLVRGTVNRQSRVHLFLAAAVVSSWIVFGFTPYVVEELTGRLAYAYLVVRFSLVPLALTAIGTGVVLSMIASSVTAGANNGRASIRILVFAPVWLLIAATIGTWLWNLLSTSAEDRTIAIYTAAAVVLLLVLALKPLRRYVLKFLQSPDHHVSRCLALIASVAFVLATPVQARWWHRDFFEFYGSHLDTEIFSAYEKIGPSARVAALDFWYYPLLGSRRQYEVFRPAQLLSPNAIVEVVAIRSATHVADAVFFANDSFGYAAAGALVRRHDTVFQEVGDSGAGLFHVDRTELEHLRKVANP